MANNAGPSNYWRDTVASRSALATSDNVSRIVEMPEQEEDGQRPSCEQPEAIESTERDVAHRQTTPTVDPASATIPAPLRRAPAWFWNIQNTPQNNHWNFPLRPPSPPSNRIVNGSPIVLFPHEDSPQAALGQTPWRSVSTVYQPHDVLVRLGVPPVPFDTRWNVWGSDDPADNVVTEGQWYNFTDCDAKRLIAWMLRMQLSVILNARRARGEDVEGNVGGEHK